ncbi:MAG: hypothetical protein ACTHOU_02860 [Aureliella sp.]|jgi:hypothetical protein
MNAHVVKAGFACTLILAGSTAYALYSVSEKGDWPKSWPQELEALRSSARTLVGPMAPFQHHAIRFSNREDLLAAWPHILKVKTKGAPIFLTRRPNFFLGEDVKAGVIVHCPPTGQSENPATPEKPINSTNARERWMYTTYIELLVDGSVVDLNHLPLPPDTPIIDERF